VAFLGESEKEPTFAVIPGDSLKKGPDKATLRHETHHLICNLLERRGDFLRKSTEPTPELREAFCYFRNEVAAIILENQDLRCVLPEFLSYTEDGKILNLVENARDFIAICIEIAKQKKVDPQIFLYAAMSSRNFKELKSKFSTLTPLEKIDQENIALFHTVWVQNKDMGIGSNVIREFLKIKKIPIPKDIKNLIKDYARIKMKTAHSGFLAEAIEIFNSVNKFSKEVFGLENVIEDRDWKEVVREKLKFLPAETVEAILLLPFKVSKYIFFANSFEDFLNRFISTLDFKKRKIKKFLKKLSILQPLSRRLTKE